MSAQLFRPQALQALASAKFGEPVFYQPVTLKVLSGAAVLMFVAFLMFIILVPFKSLESVTGALSLSKGSVDIFSAKPGVLTELYVTEGALVKKGEPLALVHNEGFDAEGRNGATQQLAFVDEQILLLTQGRELLIGKVAGEQAQRKSALSTLNRELAQLRSQQELIESRVMLSEASHMRDASLWHKEMLADAGYEKSSDAYLTAQIQAKSNALLLLTKAQAVLDAQAQIDLAPLSNAERLLELDREILLLRSRRHELLAQTTFSIVSPRDGVVGNIAPVIGDQLDPSYPLLKVLSPEQSFEAHLFVPSRAVGRLKNGQQVLLRFDALPNELYGRFSGEVNSISAESFAVRNDNLNGITQEPMYLVKVAIDRRLFVASVFNRLRSGMGVNAEIVTDEKTLFARFMNPMDDLGGRI